MILVLRGTTCSGKDTFINEHFEPSMVLSSDEYREILTGDRSNQKNNKDVFDLMYQVLETRLKNRVPCTVMNATHLKFKDCHTVVELSKKYRTPVMVVSIQPPKMEELKQRNRKRTEETGFAIPEDVIDKHYHRYTECMEPFLKEAVHNRLFTFSEMDQKGNVVRLIDGGES